MIILSQALSGIVQEALPTVYSYQNCVVSVNAVVRDFALTNNLDEGSLLQIEVDLTGFDPLGEPFVIPFTLQNSINTPIVKHANGQPTTDEKYLQTTVTAGHFIMKGRLPSGDWKITQDRVNAALKQINAPFQVSTPTLTFLVSTPQ